MSSLLPAALLFMIAGSAAMAAPGPRVLPPGPAAPAGALEWSPYDQGFTIVSDGRRAGAQSVRCENRTAGERRGAFAILELDQRVAAPVVITGWSKARDVSGEPDPDYSIYVDLEYMDGTSLWGQIAPFDTGTHGWRQQELRIVPARPIRTLRLHALFRNHTGAAWFDDFTAKILSGESIFDGQPIRPPALPAGATRGWFVRDVAAGSGIVPLLDAAGKPSHEARRLGLRFFNVMGGPQSRTTGGTVEDTTGKPRAVTAYYVERFPAADGLWWNDIRSHEPAGESGERSNWVRAAGVGANESLSLYPFGCVTTAGRGRALGVPPLLGPRIARIGFHARGGLLYVAFDVALDGHNRANSDGRGHGRARVEAVRYAVDPAWGFRDAAVTYYRLFPDAFARRARADGIWMPFTDPAKVERIDDFGVAYHEGDNSVASDDRLGILSFRYTEPMTYWMPMKPDVPRTYDAALGMVRARAAGPSGEERRWASAVLSSGTHDARGRFNVEFRNEPWANGAVWTLNPNPLLPHRPNDWTKARLSYTREMGDREYGPKARGTLDGEYLDSLEGWADVLDYRPESLRASKTPPTFATRSFRPVLPTWFSVYELAAGMRDDLRRRGKLLMANTTPWRFWAFPPLLDVLGTEIDWLSSDGKWQPDSDAFFNLRRTLCYRKPYLLLQNTDFDRFGPEEVRKYFERCLFYAVFPSMFSANAATHPYWETPRWYNRDRDLFKTYLPIVRLVSAAGWEPITHARSSHDKVYVERYGRDLMTLLNDSDEPARAEITIDLARWRTGPLEGKTLKIVDLVADRTVATVPAAATVIWTVTLDPQQGRAYRLAW